MTEGPKILDGKWLAKLVQDAVAQETASRKLAHLRVPGLGVVLVGDNPASQTYVASKERFAHAAGLETFNVRLPIDASSEEVGEAIDGLNGDSRVDGILLQLPLPPHLSSAELLDRIRPDKDADGLHPVNQGFLMRGTSQGCVRPCTPLGVMKLIDMAFSSYGASDGAVSLRDIPEASLAGKKALVIGRSILVGKPMSLMLLERNATVTMAHSKTPDLPAVTRDADIIVAAVGVPRLVKGDWVKPGAVVLDVGINRLPDGKLVGDVDFESVAPKCRAISPVPGGAGPMTVAMLIANTLELFKHHLMNSGVSCS